jgi:hypothetical protein
MTNLLNSRGEYGKTQVASRSNFALSRVLDTPSRCQLDSLPDRMTACPRLSPSAARRLFGPSSSEDGRFMDWQQPSPISRFAICANKSITKRLSSALHS